MAGDYGPPAAIGDRRRDSVFLPIRGTIESHQHEYDRGHATDDPTPPPLVALGVGPLFALLVVLAVVASLINLPYYALSPGDATPVAPRIVVPSRDADHIHGAVLLTDVLLSQVTLLDYLPDRLEPGHLVVPADEVLGPATPPAQLAAQGYLEMAQSQAAAKAAALSRLGYGPASQRRCADLRRPTRRPCGQRIRVGEIVTAVGTTPTPDACALIGALQGSAPGIRHPVGRRILGDLQRHPGPWQGRPAFRTARQSPSGHRVLRMPGGERGAACVPRG